MEAVVALLGARHPRPGVRADLDPQSSADVSRLED